MGAAGSAVAAAVDPAEVGAVSAGCAGVDVAVAVVVVDDAPAVVVDDAVEIDDALVAETVVDGANADDD